VEQSLVDLLDSLGSVRMGFNEQLGRFEVRGIPCADFHHRGLNLFERRGETVLETEDGRPLGACRDIETALAAGLRSFGIDAHATPPPLKPVEPSVAAACRDWSVHQHFFGASTVVGRDDLARAVMDGLCSGATVVLEGFPGIGLHSVVARAAAIALQGTEIPPVVGGARFLELDWLKLAAGQTAGNAFGPGERLSQVLLGALAAGHVCVIGRGRCDELARVAPPDFRGIVLCNTPLESRALVGICRAVRIPVPELPEHHCRRALECTARRLERDLNLRVPVDALEMLLEMSRRRRPEDAPGPACYQVEPGSLISALTAAAQRARSLYPGNIQAAVTPGLLAMAQMDAGVPEDRMMSLVNPPVGGLFPGGQAGDGPTAEERGAEGAIGAPN
jgi:hypothetical protein